MNTEIPNIYSEDFLDTFNKLFPKGDKRRCDALVIQALAYLEGKTQGLKTIKELEKESRELNKKLRRCL